MEVAYRGMRLLDLVEAEGVPNEEREDMGEDLGWGSQSSESESSHGSAILTIFKCSSAISDVRASDSQGYWHWGSSLAVNPGAADEGK